MVRIDAGFPSAALLAWPPGPRLSPRVSRLQSNPVLDQLDRPHIVRPVGRRLAAIGLIGANHPADHRPEPLIAPDKGPPKCNSTRAAPGKGFDEYPGLKWKKYALW